MSCLGLGFFNCKMEIPCRSVGKNELQNRYKGHSKQLRAHSKSSVSLGDENPINASEPPHLSGPHESRKLVLTYADFQDSNRGLYPRLLYISPNGKQCPQPQSPLWAGLSLRAGPLAAGQGILVSRPSRMLYNSADSLPAACRDFPLCLGTGLCEQGKIWPSITAELCHVFWSYHHGKSSRPNCPVTQCSHPSHLYWLLHDPLIG